MGAVRTFLDDHFLHYNARVVVEAARAWERHLDAGGTMMVTLAGAMSTARLGRTLARMIREGKVHAVTCTGANLEEDVFALLSYEDYEAIPRWRDLSGEDETALLERGLNRVTDVCIPETVMTGLEARLRRAWAAAAARGERRSPAEFLWEILDDPEVAADFQLDPAESWVLAAKEKGLPIYTPGWEDSTTGNFFTKAVLTGEVPGHDCVMSGTEQMAHLVEFYLSTCHKGPGIGFFQIGGGIAGDFPICAVPLIRQDLGRPDVPMWAWFGQVSDAVTSYGGYSGAPPNEKITWGKLDADTPRFMIQSDATIVAPLIFGYVLGD